MAADTDKEKSPATAPRKRPALAEKVRAIYDYVSSGVWSDTRSGWKVNTIKTLNLSVRSFFNSDLQNRACGLTYQTLLAIVPALALLFAIARGFGFQNLIQSQLMSYLPAQRKALEAALGFVDSYLATASEGIFVGVGIVFLLWTLISLLSTVEDSFNQIWGVAHGRSLWRKITDYTAIFLILPILMICASGITVFMSTAIQNATPLKFLSPLFSTLLDLASLLLVWLFFAGAYMMIPNAKVKPANALMAGALAGTGFLILQWLFVSGQVYVMRYNAIYGSFAFLPLLLLWLQLVWMICLAGAVICYSSQNVFAFSLDREVSGMSDRYRAMVTLAITAVITRRFVDGRPPATARDLMSTYSIPARLVTGITDRLCADGIFNRVLLPDQKDIYGFQLAVDPSTLTVRSLTERLYLEGERDFIPDFRDTFPRVITTFARIESQFAATTSSMLVSDLYRFAPDDSGTAAES